MSWDIVDVWIIINAGIIALSATLIGTHMVLRRESLLGDAISHGVLPGIALGYIISAERNSLIVFIGAIVFGLLTGVLTHFIRSKGRIEANAAMGVIFSGLFAIGLILINIGADSVDLDPQCVLFGSIELTPLDMVRISGTWGNFELPRAVFSNGSVLLLNCVVLACIRRPLSIASFDEQFARSSGIKVMLLWYIHIILIAITEVAAFESVGSILIIALLILPPITGWLCCNSLKSLFLVSSGIALSGVIIGHAIAVVASDFSDVLDLNTGGSIAVTLGVILTIILLCSPKQGIIVRIISIFKMRVQIAIDDLLKISMRNKGIVYNFKIVTPYIRFFVKRKLCKEKLLYYDSSLKIYTCTDRGFEYARTILHAHHMWEEYLYNRGHVASASVHGIAEDVEHIRSKEIAEALIESSQNRIPIPGHNHTKDM